MKELPKGRMASIGALSLGESESAQKKLRFVTEAFC